MLDLSQDSYNESTGGPSPNYPPMTIQEIKQKAYVLFANQLAPSLQKALNYLAVAGVLTADQLGYTVKTYRNHSDTRVADRLPWDIPDIVKKFEQYGLPIPNDIDSITLYALGPVGAEMARMRFEIEPPTGYVAYTLDRIMHDVVVNELVLKIGRLAKAHGWIPFWLGEHEAAIYQDNRQILKPDALIRLRKDNQEKLVLIEYHNEDKSTRAADKVRRYEQAHSSNLWQEAWGTNEFPSILAVFRKPIVGSGYEEGLKDRQKIHCSYYGRLLDSALTNTDAVWLNIGTGEKEQVFPWKKD
ncbi:MAG: hypothetical protein DRI56_10950 [Chloroflexota bacterium]|nr:MAG: hypothetical protein DRI56_10950 [Chloroflexota bacterium]